MKPAIAFATLAVLLSAVCVGQVSSTHSPSAADEAAVRKLVTDWQDMWDKFDPSPLAGDYAPDADFLNAFGIKLKGSVAILDFAAKVVKRPNVRDRHTTWQEPVIRFLRPDLAIAYRDYETTGHRTLSEKDIPLRKTHGTWIALKQDGKWRIASQIIYDETSAQ